MSEQKKVDPVLGKTESTNYNNEFISGRETQIKDSGSVEKSQPFRLLYHFIKCAGGADEGHILHQIHYWISKPTIGKTDKHGRRFVFNTIENWQKDNFFWLSVGQLGRLFRNLEDLGFIETTTEFNSNPLDRKKWYTLNYAKIKMEESINLRLSKNEESETIVEDNKAGKQLKSNDYSPLSKNEQSTDENRDYPNLNIPIIQNQIMHYPNLNDINTSNTKNQLLQKPNITKNQPTYQNDPSGNDPLGEVGGIDKNILQTEKIHNDAIAVLCAINTARSELQQLRPASDKKDDLVYEHSESNLNSIKKILSGYPKANLEICLQVVAHRANEAKLDPENNFKHLNCHWAWNEQNFEKCLAKMKSQKLNIPKNRRKAETPTIQKQDPCLPTEQDLLEEFNAIKLMTNKEIQESLIKIFRNRNPDFAYEFGEPINEHVKIKTPHITVIEEVI